MSTIIEGGRSRRAVLSGFRFFSTDESFRARRNDPRHEAQPIGDYALLPENGHGKQAQLVACGVGGSAFRFVGFPKCPACGGPPWTYDIDLRVPADMTPGAKTFPVWVIDGEGHRADTTATIEIVRR